MKLPELSFNLTHDRRGLPALKLSCEEEVVVIIPLTNDLTRPVTQEMAGSLLAPANELAAALTGTDLSGQAAWDKALLPRVTDSQVPYPDKVTLALSLAGWRLQAKEAGQSPASWLEAAAWQGRQPAGPRQATEDIWTIEEAGGDEGLRYVGAVGLKDHASQLWRQLDSHTASGPWGGHQLNLTAPEWLPHLEQLPDSLRRLGKPLIPALWFAPPVEWVESWLSLVDQLRPEVVVDPYPLHNESEWDRLRRELEGRRLNCTIWISEDVWQGRSLLNQVPFHGIVWQPQTAVTVTDFIERWRATVEKGLLTAVAAPHHPVEDTWWCDLAVATRAAYCWNSHQFTL